jgi:hypothetical protein
MITWFVDHSSFLGIHMFFTKKIHLHKYFKLLSIFILTMHKLTCFFEENLIKYNSNKNTFKKKFTTWTILLFFCFQKYTMQSLYTTTNFWFCNFHLWLIIRCKWHMQLTTYVLFNPCCFTHLVVRDNDMAFNCKDKLTNKKLTNGFYMQFILGHVWFTNEKNRHYNVVIWAQK